MSEHAPALHAVDLEVNPPHSSHTQQRPEHCILDCATEGQPLNDAKVENRKADNKRYATEEQECVDWRPNDIDRRGGDGEEGRYGGACISYQLVSGRIGPKLGAHLYRGTGCISPWRDAHKTRGATVP
ncbi:hypothetical protein OPT61_g10505 [Boeremia exigua]|uniref:Uncharacterized protein n=1 Tax=Boeremia exigua TaxID=749465 RepID=A0ACC2HP98_9PLEO|nr:hypothetical protein OPT61_g10505 [Boeremia exigua]